MFKVGEIVYYIKDKRSQELISEGLLPILWS